MKRIVWIDILKLFTIYLVLWGHAIMHFQPDYEKSYIFQTIYAFHMPLFMMLSGYFATSSMMLSAGEFFLKKCRQLLLPCISWGIVCWIFIRSGLIEGRFHLEIINLFSGWLGLIDNFWFLKSCFICYTLSWLCYKCGRYKLLAMGVVWILCTMQGRFHLSMMFPSFIVGMLLRKSALVDSWMTRKWPIVLSLFIALMIPKLIYTNVDFYLYKLFLGLSGAIGSIYMFKESIGRLALTSFLERLARMGEVTLGIYIIQAIVLEVLMPGYINFREFSIVVVILLMPFMAFTILIFCIVIIRLINRSKLLELLMFGKK